jgi:hypothetical protein
MTDLSDVLKSRRWSLRTAPFLHLHAREVFTENVYDAMAAEFRGLLSRPGSFARNMPGYDALGYGLSPSYKGAFDIVLSKAWHDVIAHLFEIEATCDVNIALHHHPAEAGSGTPHNDLNPGWFTWQPNADGINPSDNMACSYRFGECQNPEATPYERVRAVAIIYYLANPAWEPGSGGETILFSSSHAGQMHPVLQIPPENNSLLAFACSPNSFHAYARCADERNSLIMWLHRRKEDAYAKWGTHAIVPWTRL